jgi:two-component system sensor histidine kinase HydH
LGEVRRLQKEIQRKEKLAAIGGLAAGVAHEIRNPLSSIKGIASYFRDKFENYSGDKEMAGVMIQEVDRLNRVITELLEFARPTDLNLKTTDIHNLIKHSVKLIEKEASAKGISIELDLYKQPLTAKIDSDRFLQCLLNLYINSLQAMEKGGQLRIEDSLKGKDKIIIKIKDTGSGIHTENLKKIFDPYYTTKAKGTGLGLAIAHKIIEAHDGRIKVNSAAGQGTIVTVCVPASNAV